MSIVGVPVMTKKSFIGTERDIGEMWKQALQQSMLEAGRREREIAIQKGHFHEGVPVWMVAGVRGHTSIHIMPSLVWPSSFIGKETGKLLHIGVRNKFCHAYARKIPKENHTCYRNWTASSSEMETDIILEGFLEAERVHRVRYTEFIGDGDSSVHPTLIQNVPGWGHAIRKVECANHVCKCYRGALEKLVKTNSSYKGSGWLTVKIRKTLVSAARCAIRMRSKEKNRVQALALLRKNLINGPRHCFGIHTHCSPDLCTTVRDLQVRTATTDLTASLTATLTGTAKFFRRYRRWENL